jgi:CubicO group peptidase (beta-lactamase class C family)
MLLNHTGAISNPYPDGGAKLSATKATLVQHFLGQTPAQNPPLQVEREPGETYKYCNGCYSILQMVLEDITGTDYRDLVRNELLIPLNMRHSNFEETLLDDFHPDVAINYNDFHKPHPPQRKLPIYATGALWSTATDLARFILEIQKALTGQSTVIAQTVARDLVMPSSTPVRSLGFFLGDRLGDDKEGGSYFSHGGQNVGYLSMMIGNMDKLSGAVVMINISSPWNATDFPHFKFVKEAINAIGHSEGWDP